jgi:hypothetical protein
MQSVSDRRWQGGALPPPNAAVEWTVVKLLESLQLQHHEPVLEGISIADLLRKTPAEVKALPGAFFSLSACCRADGGVRVADGPRNED